MNSDYREHLRGTLRLIRLDTHLISGDLLVILLAKHGDHIECSAAGQTGGDQFDRLRPRAARSIVQQQVMAAPGLGYKLPLGFKGLSEVDLRGNQIPSCFMRSEEHE